MKDNFTNLKITSGDLKGKNIKSPKLKTTHPMGSRERLALMNIIGPEIKDSIILDCYAGTGAIGIEALSRGVKHVTFIEKDPKAVAVLKENLKALGLSEKSRVIKTDADKIDFDDKFDFVIADPPYDKKFSVQTLNDLGHLSKKRFILSHPSTFDPHALDLKLISTKSYAAARLSVYEN